MDIVQLQLYIEQINQDLDMLSPASLKELALLTSVVSRTANNNLISVLENPNIVQSNRAQLFRIQKLMLNLMQKFVLSEDRVKRLLSNNIFEKNSFQTSERLLYTMQIAANLLCYARNIVANHDIEHGISSKAFYPALTDPKLHTFHGRSIGNVNEQEPNLGLIVQQSISTVTYQHQENGTFDLLERKIKEVPQMNLMDLKIFINDSLDLCDLIVKKKLKKLL